MLPDTLYLDGGLLGITLCAAQHFHLAFSSCYISCTIQYPHTAVGQIGSITVGCGA